MPAEVIVLKRLLKSACRLRVNSSPPSSSAMLITSLSRWDSHRAPPSSGPKLDADSAEPQTESLSDDVLLNPRLDPIELPVQ